MGHFPDVRCMLIYPNFNNISRHTSAMLMQLKCSNPSDTIRADVCFFLCLQCVQILEDMLIVRGKYNKIGVYIFVSKLCVVI